MKQPWRDCRQQFPRPPPPGLPHNHDGDDYDDDGFAAGRLGLGHGGHKVEVLDGDDEPDQRRGGVELDPVSWRFRRDEVA